MTTHVMLPAAERVWKPWKNGGGEMADIGVVPANAGHDDFKCRIAIARIDGDRPFSDFPGVDRTFMVVGGKGVRLSVDGMDTARLTHKSPPFNFPGDKPTQAQLIDGPVHALNVMTRRGVADSRVGLADGPSNFVAGDEAYAVLVWARGSANIAINGVVEHLELHDAILFAGGTEVQIAPAEHSHGWLVEVRVRPTASPAT
jgi:uncharacterized protein